MLAHSNEAEWQQFKNNKNNEAFLDRISRGQGALLPAGLRGARSIYDKLLQRQRARSAPHCAPEVAGAS